MGPAEITQSRKSMEVITNPFGFRFDAEGSAESEINNYFGNKELLWTGVFC